jgi:hypothetical protein
VIVGAKEAEDPRSRKFLKDRARIFPKVIEGISPERSIHEAPKTRTAWLGDLNETAPVDAVKTLR